MTEPNLQKSFGSLQVFLNKAPIAHKSKMQTRISLSMAEGELIAACKPAQIMLFSMHALEDIGLCVKKPMILWVDCIGVMHGWNVSGLMKHVSVRACFLCELKESNLILCMWLPTDAKHGGYVHQKTCHHVCIIVINVLLCTMTQ